MTSARETLAAFFFRGDTEAARCLFETNGENVAVHVPGGAQRNPLLAIDWWPYVATLLDNHDIGPFEFDVIQGGTAIQTRDLPDAKSHPSVDAINRALKRGATFRLYGVSKFESNLRSAAATFAASAEAGRLRQSLSHACAKARPQSAL